MDLTPLEQSPSTADQPTALLAAELVKSSPSACAAALQWLQVWLQSALVGSAEFVGSPSQEPAAKRSKSSNREGTNGSRVEKKVVSAVVDKVASAALDVHGEGRLQFAFWAAAVLQSIPTGITASNGGNVEPAMVVERGIAVLQEHTATSSLLQLLVSTLERDTDNSDSVMIRGLVDMLSISEEPSALGVLGLICIQAPEITLTALLLALLRMDTTQGEKWDRTAGMVSRVGQYAAEWFPAAFRDCVRKLLRQPAVKQAGPGLMKHFATHSEPCALAMVLKIVFEEMKDTLVAAVPLTNLKEFIQLSSSDSPSLASWPSWFSLVIKAAEIQPVLLTQFVDILATAAAARVNTSLVTEGSSTTTAPDAAQGCRQVLRLASWLAQEQVISEGGSTTHGTPLPDCRLISALSGQHLKLLETANAFADVDRNDIVHSSTLADLDILAVVSALAGSNDAPHWTLRRLLFDEGRASRHSSSRFVNAAFAFLGCGVNPFPELVTSVMSEDHLSLQLVGALLEVSEKLMMFVHLLVA